MNIYTITLNPAYDIHASVNEFSLFHENLAHIMSRDAGGKGVNLSRALKSGGVENTAVVVLGEDNSVEFKGKLVADDLHTILLEKPGRIRENLTLHCSGKPETRISFPGFTTNDNTLHEIATLLDIGDASIVTFTGRVPCGVSMYAVKSFLKHLQAKGAKIVLDSKSFTKEDVLEIQPWLIKPNQDEFSEYFNCTIGTIEDVAEKVQFFSDHNITNVMVSMGEKGALLMIENSCYVAIPPAINAISTIGAGDSSLAGFIVAFCEGKNPADCLKSAVAYGTAACLTLGSLPPTAVDISEIHSKICVRRL